MQPADIAVLFDLDGTLVDSSRTILDSVEHALQSMDIDPAGGPPVERLIGRPLLDIFTDAFGMPRPQALEAITTLLGVLHTVLRGLLGDMRDLASGLAQLATEAELLSGPTPGKDNEP